MERYGLWVADCMQFPANKAGGPLWAFDCNGMMRGITWLVILDSHRCGPSFLHSSLVP